MYTLSDCSNSSETQCTTWSKFLCRWSLRELGVVGISWKEERISHAQVVLARKALMSLNSCKLQRHKNFDQVVHWVSDEFEQSDKVYMTPFKEKYVEVYGSPAKNWEKVSRRVRERLNLEAKSIMETYVGKRKKLCKPQIWFWVKKAWSWNGFRFFENQQPMAVYYFWLYLIIL